MKIVFVTTCKNREAHLLQTLPQNLTDNPRSTFVVLDYGSDKPLEQVPNARTFVYRYDALGPFHMAHAKNMAHRLGILHGADLLCNVDADNYLHAGYEDFLGRHYRSNTYFRSPMVKGWGRKFRGVAGRIAVSPRLFAKTGGYSEVFDHWDHDDKEFDGRVRYLGYEGIETPREYLEAIPHGDGVRFREYPHIRQIGNSEEAPLGIVKTAVANYGNFGVGEVSGPNGKVYLDPVPTRLFGIGLHKTGTTSLHKAFQLLGFESTHWSSGTGTWARDIWEEMLEFGKSKTVEQSYALADLPIGLLYRELDRAYPGSKFVLTTRSEPDWLRSVRDHFSDVNPSRWEWDVYPIGNRIHQALYGRKDFDADTFLRRFRRHNAEVKEYFRNRPGDLLVMPQPSWYGLSHFLNKPVPKVPYPREGVTARAPTWQI